MLNEIERIIVDWFDAQGIQTECPEGEWLANVSDDRPSISLTKLAAELAAKIANV